MATQTVSNYVSIVIPRRKTDRWERIKDFFGGISDYLGLFFNSGASIEMLEKANWTKLSVEEKANIDVDLLGLRR